LDIDDFNATPEYLVNMVRLWFRARARWWEREKEDLVQRAELARILRVLEKDEERRRLLRTKHVALKVLAAWVGSTMVPASG